MGTTQNPNNDKPFLTTAPDFAGSVRLDGDVSDGFVRR